MGYGNFSSNVVVLMVQTTIKSGTNLNGTCTLKLMEIRQNRQCQIHGKNIFTIIF